MPDKEKKPEKIPQSDKVPEEETKPWTKEEMEKANPMPLPKIDTEKEKDQKDK